MVHEKNMPSGFESFPMDYFLIVDSIRVWNAWDYNKPELMKTLNYLIFFSDAKGLAEQIEAMQRGLG